MTTPHDEARNSPIDRGMAAPIDPQLLASASATSDQSQPVGNAGRPTTGTQTAGSNTATKLIQNKTAVLLTLFCVTGFLGLPLLWLNKRFSSVERVLWTVLVCLYSLSLIAGTIAICRWAYAQISGV